MTHIQMLTMPSEVGDPDSPAERFASALRNAGVPVEVAPFTALKPAAVTFWEFGGIDVQAGSPPSAIAAALRAALKRDDLGAIFLMNTPRGPRSLQLADALGLAGAIELHDCWLSSLPPDLAQPPDGPVGFIGRTDLIDAGKCPLLSTNGAYSKCDFSGLPNPLFGLADYLAQHEEFRQKPRHRWSPLEILRTIDIYLRRSEMTKDKYRETVSAFAADFGLSESTAAAAIDAVGQVDPRVRSGPRASAMLRELWYVHPGATSRDTLELGPDRLVLLENVVETIATLADQPRSATTNSVARDSLEQSIIELWGRSDVEADAAFARPVVDFLVERARVRP